MPNEAFLKLNQVRVEQGQTPAVNPRNAAAGTIRTLEPNIVAQRRLDFYAYFALQAGESIFPEQVTALDGLSSAGFRVNPQRKELHTLEELLEPLCPNAEGQREALGTRSTGW